jgi:hypothetical protein
VMLSEYETAPKGDKLNKDLSVQNSIELLLMRMQMTISLPFVT